MKIGFFGANMGAAAGAVLDLAVLAEELGYESLWMGEHVVAPSPRVPPSPIEPDYPMLDPIVTFAAVAAVTRRVRLGTGIIILPQRNPVVLAKEVATLDVLSEGRLELGIGVGYVEPEMRAIGVPMEHRGTRSDEYLRAMRSLWEDDTPGFHGEYVSFEGVEARPRPVQRPLPVVVGGHTPAAHRRTIRLADGWYGFALDRDRTAEQIDALKREAEAAGRDFGGLSITVSPAERVDAGVVRDFARLGVTRLALLAPRQDATVEDLEAHLRAHAPERLEVESAV